MCFTDGAVRRPQEDNTEDVQSKKSIYVTYICLSIMYYVNLTDETMRRRPDRKRMLEVRQVYLQVATTIYPRF